MQSAEGLKAAGVNLTFSTTHSRPHSRLADHRLMEPSNYITEIQQRLHPRPYTDLHPSPPAGVDLLLTCKKYWLARYALAIAPWDNSMDGTAFLGSRRRLISSVLDASLITREVGLYLLVTGSEPDWRDHVANMPADKTGLHAVIVQAVHFVDLQSGATAINQSAWGPVKFGGVDSVASVVNSIPISRSKC